MQPKVAIQEKTISHFVINCEITK